MTTPNEMDGTRGNAIKIDSKIKVATLNVRGFKNKKKKYVLCRNFKKDNLDIIGLQETYIKDDLELKEVLAVWGGEAHYTPGTVRSKGLITLFNPKYSSSEIKLVFRSDRILISSIVIDQEILFIINVYCPCIEQEKLLFLDVLQEAIKMHCSDANGNLICLGDFNIALGELGVVAGQPHKADMRLGLNRFVQSIGLTDTWRSLHPDDKENTWHRVHPPSAKRLDYVFISDSLVSYLDNSIITSYGFSDHRLVVCHFTFVPFKFGKGLYKINTSLLKDNDYCNLIKHEIHDTLNKYSEFNPHLRWEMVKKMSKRYHSNIAAF